MNSEKIRSEKMRLNKEYNKLTCRETINDYLYYGYGIDTFIAQDYEYAKDLTRDEIKQLFEEQIEYLGNIED